MKEFLTEQLERTNYWLAFAEAKNVGLVALNIAIVAACTQITEIPIILRVLLCCLFLVAIMVSLVSFVSNLSGKIGKKNKEDSNKYNLIFYRDVAKIKDVDTYLNALKINYKLEQKDEEKPLYKDFVTEIIINSEIAVYKYNMFNLAIAIDIGTIIIFIISLIVA